MKELSQYSTVEEVLEDAIKESIVLRQKAIKEDRVQTMRKQILDHLTKEFGNKNVQRWMLNRIVRPDRYGMREFKQAIRSLVDEKRITEEKQVTSDSKRPAVYYRLFEN